MVFDEESDMFAKNSGLKDSEVAQGVHSFGNSGQEKKNLSLSLDKNLFYNNKVNKEVGKLRSIYDFPSEDSESDEKEGKIKGQQKTYSRIPRYSQLVRRNSIWNSSTEKYEKETKSCGGQTKLKQKSREKLQVVCSKPKTYMHDLFKETLKDKKNRRNSIKRKLFNPSGDLENNEDQGHRSSNRKRKVVNYLENRDECTSESSSDNESESEDENKNKIKKRVECPAIVKKSHLSEYEQMVERNKEANRKMLEQMGIVQAKTELDEFKTRIKSKEPKPKYCMRDITNKKLKLEKNRRKYNKRKRINPSIDIENREQGHRSSSRRRKIVNYVENQDNYNKDGGSGSEKESEKEDGGSGCEKKIENEDENGNDINKRVECSTTVKTLHLSSYEQMVERNKEAKRQLMEEMGIVQTKTELVEPKTSGKKTKVRVKHTPDLNEIRRSHRLKKKIYS